MDYETDQLNKYDMADAQRYLMSAVKKPDPKFELFGVGSDELAKGGQAVKEGFKRTVVGGARDAAQGIMNTGRDFIEAGAEDFLAQSFGRADGSDIRLNIPAPRLPEVEEPESFIGQLGRDFVQFGVGLVASPNKFGPANLVVKSAISDAYFDPEEGGFIRPLIDLGVLPEAMEFLAVDVNEESTAEERLRGRLKLGGQGALAGGVLDGMVRTLKLIKNNPEALKRAGATLAAALGVALPLEEAESGPIKTLIKRLSRAENQAIDKTATKDGVLNKKRAATIKKEAIRIKNLYPTSEGWLPININPGGTAPAFKINKKGNITIKWQEPSYQFHLPPNYVGTGKKPKADEVAAHQADLTDRMIDDVEDVVNRALSGDQAAKDIIGQANWYRTMRTRLRQEFGGLGDVFADLLGATSAQTLVQQNYDNALTVLRRYTRGEFDEEIAMYAKMAADGEPLDQKTLTALHKDENSPFKLITKAGGELFNTNSPAATGALLDMFRQIKVGQSPKTINFTGNLIGFGNEATIDVWAARYLRDAAGLPRIPPPAEKAVAGKHLTGSTLEEPIIGGEFGFGQKVFAEAAKQINKSGIIKNVDPSLGDLGADDLQAVIWFLEKEKWTKNGWTSKGGEGGSLDFESDFGGSPDRARVTKLRSMMNKKFTPPNRRKTETDAEYEKRVETARLQNEKDKQAAAAELETLKGSPQRFTAGIARERPDSKPDNIMQNEFAQEVLAPVMRDDKVIGAQANSNYGEFMGDPERSLNYEVVTQTDFDPTEMTKAIVEAGRKYDQDAVFVSKVVPDGTPNARPGVEVYFDSRRLRQGGDALVEQIRMILRDNGMEGYSFITDARFKDRVDVQAVRVGKLSLTNKTIDATEYQPTARIYERLGSEPEAAYVGVKFQYIPEFDEDFVPAKAEEILKAKTKEFAAVMKKIGQLDGITYADVVFYDTKVFKNTDRPGAEWINGGTSYEEHLGGAVGGGASQRRAGEQLFSEAAP